MGKKKKQLYYMPGTEIPKLLDVLKELNYQVIGPQVRDNAIVLDEINSEDELPTGVTDSQTNHEYRLKKTDDPRLFHFNVGPHSPKKFLFPPQLRLQRIVKSGNSLTIEDSNESINSLALFGIKPCELSAIAIQDKVFIKGEFIDSHYSRRRKKTITIVTNCTKASETCFCTSMDSGPRALSGFDLALTEVTEDNKHFFLVESDSKAGDKLISALSLEPATEEQDKTVDRVVQGTVEQISKKLDAKKLQKILYDNLDHKQWDDVAARCLSCGNCTMVCPTCFCSTVEEVTALTGEYSDRVRRWDSCFSKEYSYIHGGAVRSTTKARYRQWFTHKLAGWHEQFQTSGCVGCGRCITWCPTGIDLTEEAKAICQTSSTVSDKKEVSQ